MPPHNCEIIGPLFLQAEDGTLVPLSNVQTIQIEEHTECTYTNDLWSVEYYPFEFSATGRMTHRSARMFRKQIMADMHRISRHKRNRKRRKEKLRRLAIKADSILRG